MQSGKKVIFFYTAFLILVVFWGMNRIEKQGNVLFSVELLSDGEREEIVCWKDDDGDYYVFLPSYADLEKTYINLETEVLLSINGVCLEQGMCCDVFELNIPYIFTYYEWGELCQADIMFVQSGGIATMFIDTESGGMDYIHREKGNKEAGTVNLYTSDGKIDYKGNVRSLKGRGNNTWESFDKKPYSLDLSDEADLLRMGMAENWILLANADDTSNLRNKIVYDFAKVAGLQYSPDSQWVDLYLNNEYVGVYLLCERNEVHINRVDIADDESFLVSLEREDRLITQKYPYISTAAKQNLRIHYPASLTDEKREILVEKWQSIENAILAEDNIDSITGKHLMELIDLDSWVKKYLIEEIFGSGDACFISQYFYYDGSDSSDKIFAGPVWDFDHSIGNKSAWQLINPRTFYANRLNVKDGFDTPWFYYLYQKPLFYNRMVEIYQNEFLPLLSELLNGGLEKYAEEISRATEVNLIRWFSGEDDTIKQEEYMNTYMLERIEFLNNAWIENTKYYLVKADQSFGAFYAYYAVERGECLPELPWFEETDNQTFQGWYYVDTNEPVDLNRPIYEDVEIYAKWENKSIKLMRQVGKVIPLGVIFVMGISLLWVDMKRARENKREDEKSGVST